MNADEMRELDAWIRDNIPGTPSNANPTRDPAAAMDVLEKCLTGQKIGDPFISKSGKNFWIRTVRNGQHVQGEAETLPLAIALFAKELFR